MKKLVESVSGNMKHLVHLLQVTRQLAPLLCHAESASFSASNPELLTTAVSSLGRRQLCPRYRGCYAKRFLPGFMVTTSFVPVLFSASLGSSSFHQPNQRATTLLSTLPLINIQATEYLCVIFLAFRQQEPCSLQMLIPPGEVLTGSLRQPVLAGPCQRSLVRPLASAANSQLSGRVTSLPL